MTGIFTIARYEVTRRWPLWVAGFGLGVLPLMFSQSAVHTSKTSDLSQTITVLAVVLSWTVAFATGMSLVGKPLHDGRLSFYFTRPISASSIAAGKVLGGIAAIAGMQLLLALPLLSLPQQFLGNERLRLVVALTYAAIAFLAAGLVVGILARSRSRWFVVDALGVTVAATASVAMFAALSARKSEIARTFDWYDATVLLEHADKALHVLALAAAAALVAAVIAAVSIGRTDRERVHRMLSFTLWPALTLLALGGLAFARWGIQ